MNTIINAILIAAIGWFLYQRLVPAKGIKSISTSELKLELTKKGKQFIDVRTPQEFRGNHIRNFKNIPLFELQKEHKNFQRKKK